MSQTHRTEILFLRHGEPEDHLRLLGRTDPALSEKGWLQCRTALAEQQFEHIFSSPLKRCREFAESVAQASGQRLQIEQAFIELDFGDWDGKGFEQLWQEDREAFCAYRDDPFLNSPPNGESTAALLERITSRTLQLAKQHAGQRLLVVTHAGVIRALLLYLLNDNPQGCAHLTRVDVRHAAQLRISVYEDDAGRQWPQLSGLQNLQPALAPHG